MSKCVSVRYEIKINLGNYQSEGYSFEYVPEGDESLDEKTEVERARAVVKALKGKKRNDKQ